MSRINNVTVDPLTAYITKLSKHSWTNGKTLKDCPFFFYLWKPIHPSVSIPILEFYYASFTLDSFPSSSYLLRFQVLLSLNEASSSLGCRYRDRFWPTLLKGHRLSEDPEIRKGTVCALHIRYSGMSTSVKSKAKQLC